MFCDWWIEKLPEQPKWNCKKNATKQTPLNLGISWAKVTVNTPTSTIKFAADDQYLVIQLVIVVKFARESHQCQKFYSATENGDYSSDEGDDLVGVSSFLL